MPSIDEVAKAQRGWLEARERTTMLRLSAAYRGALERLNDDIERVAKAAAKPGASAATISRLEGYRDLERQIARELEAIATLTDDLVTAEQRAVTSLAHEHVKAQVGAAMAAEPATVTAMMGRLPSGQTAELVGVLADGSPLSDLLDDLGPQASKAARDVLTTGITLSQQPRVIGRKLREAFKGNAVRAQTVARTEILRAYREASRQTMAASDVVKRWAWSAARDKRTCAFCWMMHGREFDLGAPMPTHPNCRCALLPVTKTWRELGIEGREMGTPLRKGVDEFLDLDAETQSRILGPGTFAAWEANAIKLEDIPLVGRHKKWGPVGRRRTLEELVGTGRARGFVNTGMGRAAPAAPKVEEPWGQWSTVENAERATAARYPNIKFDFKGAHPDSIGPTMQQFAKLAERYPQVVERLAYVGTYEGGGAPQVFPFKTAFAHATKDGKQIGLNPDFYKDPDRLKRALAECAAEGWFPKGAGSLESILTHEFGHHVANWLTSVPATTAAFPIVSMGGDGLVGETARRWIAQNKTTKALSQYSTTNRNEAWAEAFTANEHSPPEVRRQSYVRRQRALLEALAPEKWIKDGDWKWQTDLPREERSAGGERLREWLARFEA